MSKSKSPFVHMRVQNNFLVFTNYEKITALFNGLNFLCIISLLYDTGMTRVIENFESNSLIEIFYLPDECKRQHFSCKFS